MVSLDSDFISPIEVLVKVATSPSDGNQPFLDLGISRLCVSEGMRSISDRLTILQQHCS